MLRRHWLMGILAMPISAFAESYQGSDELSEKMNRYARIHNQFADTYKQFVAKLDGSEYPLEMAKELSKREKRMRETWPLRENGWPK